jgi:hypothetical protein
MMQEDDPPEKSASGQRVENIKSWIRIAVGAVAAVELWLAIAVGVPFCDRSNHCRNYRCYHGGQILDWISAAP